jgi:hypothetical protein
VKSVNDFYPNWMISIADPSKASLTRVRVGDAFGDARRTSRAELGAFWQ